MKDNLEALTPMLKLSTALALFPPYHFHVKIQTTRKSYKIYTLVFLLFTLCIYSYYIFGRTTRLEYKRYATVIKLPDDFSNLFLLLLTIRTTTLNYTKCDELKQLLHKLERFDEDIKRNSTKGRTFFVVFLSLQFSSLLTSISHTIVFGNVLGTEFYKHYVAKHFLYYVFCTNLTMIIWIGVEIKYRYDTLNDYLLNYDYHFYETDRTADVLNRVSVHLKSIRMWHNGLCNLVEKYNNLFGISMLLFVLFDISSILSHTVNLLDMIIFQRSFQENSLSRYMVLVSVLWLATGLVRTLALALSSEILAKEAGRMTTICYKLLNEVPVVPENDYDVMLNEKLHLIARQGYFRKPHVSGAGFFEVNLGIMGSIGTWVTVYIIVFVEFIIKQG